MKTTVDYSDFHRTFQDYGRGDQFSYHGLRALYDYLVDLEDDCGAEFELDVIALCCEFTEYEDFEEIHSNYQHIGSMKQLYDHTQVIEFRDGIIIQDF